jgi:hypothetical protein
MLVLIAVGMLAVGAALFIYTRPPRICRERFERIQEGMTQEEVEAILGRPPGNYREYRPLVFVGGADFGDVIWACQEPGFHVEHWTIDELRIEVGFRSNGTVLRKEYFDSGFRHDSLWLRVRAWWYGVRLPPPIP